MATFKTPKKAPQSGGAFLDQPGIYHFSVVHMDEQPQMGRELVDGFRTQLSVLCGPEEGKTINNLFRAPNETHKDGGEFCAQVQASFFIATGLATEASLEEEELDIDLQQAVNPLPRQLIARVVRGKDKDGQPSKYLEIDGTHTYHVDDPRVANIPKNVAALNLLPKELRRQPSSFDMMKLTGKPDVKLLDPNAGGAPAEKSGSKGGSSKSAANGSNGNGNGSHSNGSSNSSSQPKQPTVSEDDLSDL